MKKILFVDDNEDIRQVTEILLKVSGYEVILESRTDFADRFDKYSLPDLILLDRHMNGKDMLEVCKQLKADEMTRDIPVIIVSADVNAKKLAEENGADDLVLKPFQRFQLIDAIERLLNKRSPKN